MQVANDKLKELDKKVEVVRDWRTGLLAVGGFCGAVAAAAVAYSRFTGSG